MPQWERWLRGKGSGHRRCILGVIGLRDERAEQPPSNTCILLASRLYSSHHEGI